MLLEFKNIGDILSLDDYNALIYLMILNNQLKERIILTPATYRGDLGDFTLPHKEEISLKGDFYLVTDVSKTLTLNIDSIFVGNYNLKIKVYSDYYDEEEFDPENPPEDIKVRELFYHGNNLEGRQEIIIPLSDMVQGEYISIYADINVSYDGMIIDKNSGSLTDYTSQKMVNNAEQLVTAINTAPTGNQRTTIYLQPGVTFELFNDDDDQDPLNSNIVIDNKNIELISGSIPSVLDAGALHRHFYITETGSLTLNNIELTNGYSLHDSLDNGKGGSIFVKSERVGGTKVLGNLNTNFCRFTNNRANATGGAIYNEDGILDIQNTFFYNNSALSSSDVFGNGGAIFNEGAS